MDYSEGSFLKLILIGSRKITYDLSRFTAQSSAIGPGPVPQKPCCCRVFLEPLAQIAGGSKHAPSAHPANARTGKVEVAWFGAGLEQGEVKTKGHTVFALQKTGPVPWAPIEVVHQCRFSYHYLSWEAIDTHVPSNSQLSNFAPATAVSLDIHFHHFLEVMSLHQHHFLPAWGGTALQNATGWKGTERGNLGGTRTFQNSILFLNVTAPLRVLR